MTVRAGGFDPWFVVSALPDRDCKGAVVNGVVLG